MFGIYRETVVFVVQELRKAVSRGEIEKSGVDDQIWRVN